MAAPGKRKVPKKNRKAVGRKVSKLRGEGKKLDQAIAIAINMAGKK